MGMISQVNKKWEINDITIKIRPFLSSFNIFNYLCINILQCKAVNGADSEAFKTEAIRHYFENPRAAEVIIFKGKREISIKRNNISKDFIKFFIRVYTK